MPPGRLMRRPHNRIQPFPTMRQTIVCAEDAQMRRSQTEIDANVASSGSRDAQAKIFTPSDPGGACKNPRPAISGHPLATGRSCRRQTGWSPFARTGGGNDQRVRRGHEGRQDDIGSERRADGLSNLHIGHSFDGVSGPMMSRTFLSKRSVVAAINIKLPSATDLIASGFS